MPIELNKSKNGMHSYSIVSGKGGSGKTMVACSLAQAFAVAGKQCLLVDFDFATGGLTYYLTFEAFDRSKLGLADLEGLSLDGTNLDDLICKPSSAVTNSVLGIEKMGLIPVGDQRQLTNFNRDDAKSLLTAVLEKASQAFDFVIVDCRGGIDGQSIEACSVCDETIVIAETDATSIQATQHLIELLKAAGIKSKIRGFVLNKVMEDPTSLAKASSSLYSVDYLGAIPFDIEATRAYIQGKIPDFNSLFSRHVQSASSKIDRSLLEFKSRGLLSAEQFSTVSLRDPATRFGGAIITTMILYGIIFGMLVYFDVISLEFFNETKLTVISIIGLVIGLLSIAGMSEEIKRQLGRIFRLYRELFIKIGLGLGLGR